MVGYVDVGDAVGCEMVGTVDGDRVGLLVGNAVVGDVVGLVGDTVGIVVGDFVGEMVGVASQYRKKFPVPLGIVPTGHKSIHSPRKRYFAFRHKVHSEPAPVPSHT